MTKDEAIKLLGGTASKAAKAIGNTPSAISQWPDQLPDILRDRVQAALFRQKQQRKKRTDAPVEA